MKAGKDAVMSMQSRLDIDEIEDLKDDIQEQMA